MTKANKADLSPSDCHCIFCGTIFTETIAVNVAGKNKLNGAFISCSLQLHVLAIHCEDVRAAVGLT